MTSLRQRIRQVLVALILVHIGISAYRIPTKSYPRRVLQLQRIAESGFVRHFLGEGDSAKAVQWLLDNTAQDAVILCRGLWQGELELAAALLHPRMLYSADYAGPGRDSIHDRPVARGRVEGEAGRLVLVNTGTALRVERQR